MNKQERKFAEDYEMEVRHAQLWSRFTYARFAKRLIEQFPGYAIAILAEKLKEMAEERYKRAAGRERDHRKYE